MLRGPATTVLVSVLLLFGGVRGIGAETPEEIFDRGNTAYEQGQFRDAAEAFRTVLRYGIRDARVEYNLGNAEFKLGHLGWAILHYHRALRMDPTDADIKGNLELAQSYCADQVEPPELAAPIRLVWDLQNRLGPDRQAVLFLLLFWLTAGLVAWCSARPGGWSAPAGWALAALLLVLLLTGVSWQVTFQRLEGQRVAVVLDGAVEVLAGPGENNATLFTVHEGLTVEIRGERGDWFQASLPNGLNGWLLRESVGEV